ncbi:MAG TPA: hypothetical protein VKA89_10595 [Solirubrobacterales bacterium]|nr:hypothetical protein [Solirubrobacterales bacterium]
MAADTGFSAQDAQSDFSRTRRRRALSNLSRRLRREPDDVDQILPFDEVVAALGKVGERRLGLQTIPLDSIVGTVDRSREFDRHFRPTSRRVRQRWERIAKAMRRGEAMPPVEVYRIGDMHFVIDGHHRVSVAGALGWELIDAYVIEIVTAVGAETNIRLRDLATKSHERLFFERVPLPREVRERIRLTNKLWYAGLAEGVEAWGMRAMQVRREFLTREEVAVAWYRDEYAPVVRMAREADLIGDNTETEAYLKLSSLRYLLLRTHEWDEEVVEQLREQLNRPHARDEDTLVHMMRGGLGAGA